MSTPHNNANVGDIAEKVILAGDPLRVKYIAETFLENPKCYNEVRGMYGYTGLYNGKEVSVQAVGMGIPSMLIYAHELINVYGAKRLIRVGTCGTIDEDMQIKDLLIAKTARTNSAVIRDEFGEDAIMLANDELVKAASHNASEKEIRFKEGNIFTSDYFYDDPMTKEKLHNFEISCIEMETAGLYYLGRKFNKEVLSILTVSDNILTGERASTEDRQLSFNNMIKVALEII